ncbi:MAG: hypothetical protein HAW62_06215 [Endozoicomonadaceae bacterium]|nr:hypothetical protein [Endozoicomonadaceae bacterium]
MRLLKLILLLNSMICTGCTVNTMKSPLIICPNFGQNCEKIPLNTAWHSMSKEVNHD